MFLYNTLSGRKEEMTRPKGRPLKLFVCGPTVYDYSHIGHARTYIVYDAFVRYLKSKNWKVCYVENITDVDDKIIARAKEKGNNPLKLAEDFERAFLEDMQALGITNVSKYARASGYIPEIERQIKTLIQKGFAYTIPGDGVYYDISKFKDYGKLSHRTVVQAEDAVSRIDESVAKRNRGDFCLWKFPKHKAGPNLFQSLRGFFVTVEGEPIWKTDLGWGRPGWHIEDTAITNKEFGPQYDIHGGAVELKFPHHEAEIAQQEAASGKSPMVKIWMHTGLLVINNQKMSKSLKNFVSIRDALKEHSPVVLRWFFLSRHYSIPVDYVPESIEQITVVYERTKLFFSKLDFVAAKENPDRKTNEVADAVGVARQDFDAALDDDFNTPLALAAVLNFMYQFQEKIWLLESSEARMMRSTAADLLKLLGIEVKTEEIPAKITALAEKRELSRKNAQFVQSDSLRKEISALGYSIDDTPLGPFVYKI